MGDILSQHEIDTLLAALSSVNWMRMIIKNHLKNRLKSMILPDHRSSQKSILEH